MPLPAHGANASALYTAMNLKMPAQIVDLSENVNSEGLPQAVIEQWPMLLDKVSSYPHEQAEPFRSRIAARHHVSPESIVVTNGAAEALMALAQFFNGQHVALLEPSFSEYRRTLQQQNCTIHSIIADDIISYTVSEKKLDVVLPKATAIYICNPNNPTGVLLSQKWIEALVTKYPTHYFVIDEAFIDWTDEKESVISLTSSYANVFVLRSMTKMYAMAGVRLGYIVGQQAQKISAYLPHWNVSSIAIALGCMCMSETKFVARARNKSTALRLKMTADLQKLDCKVSNSVANYLLVQMPERINEDHFFIELLKKGIVLRHTKNYVGLDGKWFRIAVKTEEMWQKCKGEIEHYVKNH